eukprot:3856996-Rhodomonas_salina.4
MVQGVRAERLKTRVHGSGFMIQGVRAERLETRAHGGLLTASRGAGGGESERERARNGSYDRCYEVRPEIEYKKLQFQCNVYQECGFLYLISGCTVPPAVLRIP